MNSNIIEQIIKQKSFTIKGQLFELIPKYNLSFEEFLLLVFFLNQDSPVFDVELIEATIKIGVNKILESFTSLSNKGLISIKVEKNNNITNEIVDLNAVYKAVVTTIQNESKELTYSNIFDKFEKEFSRTLSPMEYEIINDWLSKNISEEIILGALKEATYNGVSNLRYIDKIIYEWTKNGFKTMKEVEEHLKSKSSSTKTIKEYNWLDEE